MADASLLRHATDAFVDRTPADWAAVVSRARTSRDRALLEGLRALAAVRDDRRVVERACDTCRGSSLAAWAIVAAAAVETTSSFVLVAAATMTGASMSGRLSQLVLAAAFAAAGIPLGLTALRERRSLFLLAAFASAASVFARSAIGGLPAVWSVSFFRVFHGVWMEALIPACFWQFALDFPQVLRFTAFDTWSRRMAAACWWTGAALFGANFAVARLGLDAGLLHYALRDDSSAVFWHWFSVITAPALLAILVRARRAPAAERRRVARLAAAVVCGIAPFLVLNIVRITAPAVDRWFSAGATAGSLSLYYFIVLTLTAAPTSSAIAVIADRPFEPPTVDGPRSRHAIVRRSLNDLTRRARLSARLDARLTRALERAAHARGLREARAVLGDELRSALDVATVRVLIPHRGGAFVDWTDDAVSLSAEAAIVALLREARAPIDVSSDPALRTLLPRAELAALTDYDVNLLAGVRRLDGEMAAIVGLGPRRGGMPFTRRDRWFVATLVGAATSAWAEDGNGELDGSRSRVGGSGLPSGRGGDRSNAGEVALECPACGFVATSRPLPCECGATPTLAALPRRVGEAFVVERRLGSGGMGIVYRARDVALDRLVALKTLPRVDGRAVRQLRDEARAMAALNHECIATVYGLEFWHRTPVLVMEYLAGGTLAHRLATERLTASATIALGLRLSRALVYIHGRGAWHRDLKPSNVGFTADGAVKLLDFGLATLVASPHRGAGVGREAAACIAGTPAYLPPEVHRGEPVSCGGDLWALAVIMLEAASRVSPLAMASSPRALGAAIRELDNGPVHRAPALRAFLGRALAPSPADRFRTAVEFLAALERVSAGTSAEHGEDAQNIPS